MNEIEELKITKHLDGKLKGFYTVYFAGTKEPMMKSKTKSKLLKSLFKHYAGQGE
jgi:hypothetical protein